MMLGTTNIKYKNLRLVGRQLRIILTMHGHTEITTRMSLLCPKSDCTALCIYRSTQFGFALQWTVNLNVGLEVPEKFTPSFAAQD